MSSEIDSVLAQISTLLRRDATFLRHDSTHLRHDATLLRMFVTVAKSDLHQIACDFLTVRNRVGAERTTSQDGFSPADFRYVRIALSRRCPHPGQTRND